MQLAQNKRTDIRPFNTSQSSDDHHGKGIQNVLIANTKIHISEWTMEDPHQSSEGRAETEDYCI